MQNILYAWLASVLVIRVFIRLCWGVISQVLVTNTEWSEPLTAISEQQTQKTNETDCDLYCE